VKYFSIILNFVLAIAIIVLYVLYFSVPGDFKESTEDTTDSLALPSELAIAYVVEDSLLSKYDYFLELAEDLEEKRSDMENDYTLKAQGLQKEIEAFQRTAGNMTMNQARALEEDLVRKRQNLMLLQEKMGQDLMQAETEVNTQLYEKVTSYIEELAAEKGYTMIFNVKRGNAILYGHQGMDITESVVQGLNDAYKVTNDITSPASSDNSN